MFTRSGKVSAGLGVVPSAAQVEPADGEGGHVTADPGEVSSPGIHALTQDTTQILTVEYTDTAHRTC